MLAQEAKKPLKRKDVIKCPDEVCFMYLFLSLCKLNLFVNLLGLVLICTKEDSSELLMALQGLICALAVTHFGLFAASFIGTTSCANSLAWRFIIISIITAKLAAFGLAITISVKMEDKEPAWYLYFGTVISTMFFVYEVRRTQLFARKRG